jgi:hypothetical protein
MALTKVHDRMIDKGRVNVRDFGAVGDGITDDTAAIQTALNYASNNERYTVYFPEGHYIISQVYLYYDAVLNPNYNSGTTPRRDGKLRFLGDGNLAVADMKAYRPNYGSIIEATGDGVVVSRTDASPYPARKFEAQHLTFVGNKASAYVIEAQSCPFMNLTDCSILQRNSAGHGVLARSSWFCRFDRVFFIGQTSGTGVGLRSGTSIFAGMYTMSECLFEQWRDCFEWVDGQFVTVRFENTAFQGADRDSIRISGGTLRQLNLENVYFEGTSREHDIRGVGTSLKSLSINTMFVLGAAANGTDFISDKVIKIDTIDEMDLNSIYCFRLQKPFCEINAVENNGQSSGEVSNFIVNTDTSPTGPIVLFSGVLPSFKESVVWPSYPDGYYNAASVYKLFDETVSFPGQLKTSRTGSTLISGLSIGVPKVLTGVSASVNLATTDPAVFVDVTNTTGVPVLLPNGVLQVDGRLFIIKNNAASAGIITVRNATDSSIIKTLSAGSTGMFLFDGRTTGKFIDMTI